jgi:SepF-like predicted cell division protein (DUF552 family)
LPFNLFHKKKQSEQEEAAVSPQEASKQEGPPMTDLQNETFTTFQEKIEHPAVLTQEQPPTSNYQEILKENNASVVEQEQEIAPPQAEQEPEVPVAPSKTYLKAMPLRELSDLENIKTEVKNGNIIILRVTPLASKSIEDVKTAVNDLYQFAESIDGDIARLGEERVVICPKTIRIWREKSPQPVSSEPLPTSA